MPHVLLFAATTGYQTRAFTEAARRLGLAITLATDRCHILEDPWHDRAVPVRFADPSDADAGALVEALSNTINSGNIDGIVAVADRPTLLASLTARRLGIQWHSPEATEACRSKLRMRQLFEAAGLPVPRYALAGPSLAPELTTGYPCVLKPLGLSASRGVIRADNRRQFDAALNRIRRIVSHSGTETPDEVLVEQFIPGREFALEALMTRGELKILAIFDKPDPLDGPYFEETIYLTPSRRPAAIQQAIAETCAKAARALGLSHGPIHAEMRVNPTGVYMLEIAARPIGGLCARALNFHAEGTERSLEELILLHATGKAPAHLKPVSPASGVMMIPVPGGGVFKGVSGLEQARDVPYVDEIVITAKEGETLIPLPEGASYPGFIFASGPDPASVEAALRAAHRLLSFNVLATLPQFT